MDDLELRQIGKLNVYFRKPDIPIVEVNQSLELERMVKILTGEDFEDYKGRKFARKLKHPSRFEYVLKYDWEDCFGNLTCLCSEDSCNHLIITHYKPTNIYFAVGSVCINRFDEDNSKDLYNLLNSKKCKECKTALVFKTGCKFEKNTNKKCFNRCFACIDNFKLNKDKKYKVYLNCPYACKDDAKEKGAKWDAELKQWWIWNYNIYFEELMEKYGE